MVITDGCLDVFSLISPYNCGCPRVFPVKFHGFHMVFIGFVWEKEEFF